MSASAAAPVTSPVAAAAASGSASSSSLLSPAKLATRESGLLSPKGAVNPVSESENDDDDASDDDGDAADITPDYPLSVLSTDKVIAKIEQTPGTRRTKNDLAPLENAPQIEGVAKDVLAIQTKLVGKTPRIIVAGTAADLCSEKLIADPDAAGGYSKEISVRMYEIDNAKPEDVAKKVAKLNGKTRVRVHLYPTDKRKGPMRFITRAPTALRTNPLPANMRGDVVTGVYKFRLPLQDFATQHEVGLLMKKFGALYLTIPQSESTKAHARMFDTALAPGELHSHIMTAEIIRVRNDTNTSMRAVMEVPRFSLDDDQSSFRPLVSDGTDGSFSVPVNYDGDVLDAYGKDDAAIFDAREQCKGLVGSPEYHRWCNVTNVGALLHEMRNTIPATTDEHFAYYLVPLPPDDIPVNLAQYMVIQHNIELFEATALVPPREVQNVNADSAEAKKKEKEWASALEKATNARFSRRRKKLNALKREWRDAMQQFDAMRVTIDKENALLPADQQREIPDNAPVFPDETGSTHEEIEAELMATTMPRPVHTTLITAKPPELIKTENGFSVRVSMAALEAMVYHMANLYNPEQTAVNKTLMRIKLVPEHPDDTEGKSFSVNHKREVLQKRVSSACINVTVRTTEMVYTGSGRSACAETHVQDTKAEVISAAFTESHDYDRFAQFLSDKAEHDVLSWETAARMDVLFKGTLREQASTFYAHAEVDRLPARANNEAVGEAAKAQLLDAKRRRQAPESLRGELSSIEKSRLAVEAALNGFPSSDNNGDPNETDDDDGSFQVNHAVYEPEWSKTLARESERPDTSANVPDSYDSDKDDNFNPNWNTIEMIGIGPDGKYVFRDKPKVAPDMSESEESKEQRYSERNAAVLKAAERWPTALNAAKARQPANQR
jgi:hypothetical protein